MQNLPDINEHFRGRHVLVTGARGFLATALLRQLSQISCRITCLSRTGDALPHAADANAQMVWQQAELDKAETWQLAMAGVDTVFHLAAQTSARVADANPIEDFRANVLPAVHLLESCRLHGTRPTVLFAGTTTLFGLPQRLPVDESFPDHPLSHYELHKSLAEQYLAYYCAAGWTRGTTLRLTNLYGPGPVATAADRGVLNRMIRAALAGEPLSVFGRGEALRDYLFVDDAAEAFLLAACHAVSLPRPSYVVGSGTGHRLRDAIELVAQRVGQRTGREVQVKHDVAFPNETELDRRNFVANPQLFCQATGWQPRCDLAAGIGRTIEASTFDA